MIQVVDVSDPVVMQRNVVSGRTHGTCVRSRDTANSSLKAAVIRSRQNRWRKGTGAVFSGAPAWDSLGDTVL